MICEASNSKYKTSIGFLSAAFALLTLFMFLPQSHGRDLAIFDWPARNSGGFWRPLTDAVRGGNSTANMTVVEAEGYALIAGELRLNSNDAGFASYRLDGQWDLSQSSALEFNAMGDGREYKILLKDDYVPAAGEEVGTFQLSFVSSAVRETKVLALANVEYVVRGRVTAPPRALNLSQIKEIGIQINDGLNGPYQIRVYSLIAR